MSESIITPYDITLAKMLAAYRQGAQRGKIGVVVDETMYADDGFGYLDTGDDIVCDNDMIRHVCVYDPEFGSKTVWLMGDNDHSSQIGDIVSYESRCGDFVMTKNFTRESKKQIIKNFDRAYKVVFGNNLKGNGK